MSRDSGTLPLRGGRSVPYINSIPCGNPRKRAYGKEMAKSSETTKPPGQP